MAEAVTSLGGGWRVSLGFKLTVPGPDVVRTLENRT